MVQLLYCWLERVYILRKKNVSVKSESYVIILKFFIAWLVICFLWSVLVLSYPFIDTVQVSRQLIIGYFTFFIFVRLFCVDIKALSFWLNSLYVITFILLLIAVLQSIFNVQVLYGLYRGYDGATRYLPSFLAICFFFFWIICARLLSAQKVSKHALVYLIMVLLVMAATYTRGIYLSFFVVFMLLMILLIKDNKLRIKSTLPFIGAFILLFSVVLVTGAADKMFSRLLSGLNIISSTSAQVTNKDDADTFTGRLLLVKERFVLVIEHNAVLGYGFLHESNVPKEMTKNFKYGSSNNTPKYLEMYKWGLPYVLNLYSVDIGWADIVLKTGYIGLLLFITFLIVFYINYFKKRLADSPDYYLKLGAYLQLVMLFMLMFNGNTFISSVQVQMIFMAIYAFVNKFPREKEFKPLVFEAV